MSITEQDLFLAFKKNHEGNLKKVHLYLNKKYYIYLFNDNETLALDSAEIRKLKYIERIWMGEEIRQCFSRYDCYQTIRDITDVKFALRKHPIFRHKLFHFLQFEATREDIKNFILSDSILNLEFFDYLLFSMIGASDQARSEIIANLWDEAGRGNVDQFHTTLFKSIMSTLGLTYKRDQIIETMTWEGLAGINLFSYLACYPHNKMKYYGLLAATEMLDPLHYHQLIKGFSRIDDQHILNYDYYREHEIIDVDHANGWLNKVILPELNLRPDKITEFWLGYYLRLDSALRYFDRLLHIFTAKQAA